MTDHFVMIMMMSIIKISMIMFFGVPTATKTPLMTMIMIIMSLVGTSPNNYKSIIAQLSRAKRAQQSTMGKKMW